LYTIQLPSMDRGNHLSYGYQWIAFGILAPIGLGWFIYTEFRERRRAEKEQAELAALGRTDYTPHSESSQDVESSNAIADVEGDEKPAEPVVDNHTTVVSRRRRGRYGDAHPDHYAQFNKRSQVRA